MTFTIPSGIFDQYYEVCDELLNNNFIGKLCTLNYPPIRQSTNNIGPQLIVGTSNNVYQNGQPAPFGGIDSVYTGGTNLNEPEVTTQIRLRIYWNRKDWVKVTDNLVLDNAECQVIGFLSDLPKVLRAESITLVNEQKFVEENYVLVGKPFLWGFAKNRYFAAFLKK